MYSQFKAIDVLNAMITFKYFPLHVTNKLYHIILKYFRLYSIVYTL